MEEEKKLRNFKISFQNSTKFDQHDQLIEVRSKLSRKKKREEKNREYVIEVQSDRYRGKIQKIRANRFEKIYYRVTR